MINVTNMFDEAIGGTLTATIGDEVIPVTDNLFVFTPTQVGTFDIIYTYTDNDGKYATTSVTKTYVVEVLPPQVSTENLTISDSTNITAYLYDENGVATNGGQAIFRVNDKTLRNDEGNIIYVDVVDGVAQLPNVNITEEWFKPDTTIQAVYFGNDEFDPIYTEKTSITVTKPEAQVEIISDLTATVGETVTLTANVTSGDKLVNSGRVVFKLNGKTLKGEDGEALYVDVVDGVATTTYTILAKTRQKRIL